MDVERDWMLEAIEESRRSPMTATAFAVGAIIVASSGEELVRAHSRQSDPHDHAEEAAFARLRERVRVRLEESPLVGATLYSSLEPCSRRSSRPVTCTQLVLDSGIRRVVIAAREPDLFVDCEGVEILTAAGVEVVELEEMAGLVRAVNHHLDWPTPVRH
jgi:diaminohydroxyphosphoribosylaminopyrimidine deaminase / 5-amino-6-(5-phosphoribosylamino)uracil reductase